MSICTRFCWVLHIVCGNFCVCSCFTIFLLLCKLWLYEIHNRCFVFSPNMFYSVNMLVLIFGFVA